MLALPGHFGHVSPVWLIVVVVVELLLLVVVPAVACVAMCCQAVLAVAGCVVMALLLCLEDAGLAFLVVHLELVHVGGKPGHGVLGPSTKGLVDERENVVHGVGVLMWENIVREIVVHECGLGAAELLHDGPGFPAKHVVKVTDVLVQVVDVVDLHGAIWVLHVRLGVDLLHAQVVVAHKGVPERLNALLQRVVVQELRGPLVAQEEALEACQGNAVEDLLWHAQVVGQAVQAQQVHLVGRVGAETHGAGQGEHGQGVAHKVHQGVQQPEHVGQGHGNARHAQQVGGGLITGQLCQEGTVRDEELHGKGWKDHWKGREGKLESLGSQRCLKDGVAPKIPSLPPLSFNFFRTKKKKCLTRIKVARYLPDLVHLKIKNQRFVFFIVLHI